MLGEYGFWYNLRKCRFGRRNNVVCLVPLRTLVYFDSLLRFPRQYLLNFSMAA